MEYKVYNVQEYTVGSKDVKERIIFSTREELDKAKQDISDSKDIFVRVKDEKLGTLIMLVDNKMIGERVYKGEVMLGSLDKKGEREK